MGSNDVIVSLIKEIVKTEVKRQLKEEIVRLAKAGVITVNNGKQMTIKESMKRDPQTVAQRRVVTEVAQTPLAPTKTYSKNPLINQILNNTKPFSKAERIDESAMATTSVLDKVKAISAPPVSEQAYGMEDWETISKTTDDMESLAMRTKQNIQAANIDTSTEVGLQQAAVVKALTRNYRDLVKRF
jgi:hypothetical protein